MFEQFIPGTHGKGRIYTCQEGDEVVLEGSNGSLSLVSAMLVRGYEVNLDVVFAQMLLKV